EVLISYSRTLFPDFHAGVNLKYLSTTFTLDPQTTGDPVFSNGRSQDAFALDLGLLVKGRGPLSAGFSVKNLNRPDLGFRTADRAPVESRIGAAFSKTFPVFNDTVISADIRVRDGENGLLLGLAGWCRSQWAPCRVGAQR